MDHIALLEEDECLEQLGCVRAYLLDRESLEFVFFQVLEEISVEELEDKALMFSEVNVLAHSHDIVIVLRIFIHEKLEKFSFRFSKLMINLCVPIDFYSNYFTIQVINSGDNLCKTALSKHFKNFKAVQKMVFRLQHVIAIFIIFIGNSRRCVDPSWYIICVVHQTIC